MGCEKTFTIHFLPHIHCGHLILIFLKVKPAAQKLTPKKLLYSLKLEIFKCISHTTFSQSCPLQGWGGVNISFSFIMNQNGQMS